MVALKSRVIHFKKKHQTDTMRLEIKTCEATTCKIKQEPI